MQSIERYLPLAARILLSAVFLWSGVGKIFNFAGTVGYMQASGMPLAEFFLAGAIAFEVGGGLLLLTGYYARLGAWALIVFTVPATLLFHNYWTLDGMERYMEQIQFMKNLAIMGGLLGVARWGAGEVSVDARRAA